MPLLPNNASDVLTNPAMLGTLGRLLHGNCRDGETEIRRQAVKVGSALSDDLQQILKYIPNGDLRISGGFFHEKFSSSKRLKASKV